jgi:MGT family glycosyltransferase
VIAELVERGHRVSYAIPRSFTDVVASTGATPLIHTSSLPDETRGEQWPSDPITGMSIFAEDAAEVLPQLEAALAADRPDLVLYDITRYAGRALAHRWNVPLVQLSPSMVAWEGFEEDMGEALAFRRDPRFVEYRERFAAWLDGLGIDLDPDTFSGRPRCVVLIPRALQPHADDVDEKVYTFVGPSLDRRPHQGDWPEFGNAAMLQELGVGVHLPAEEATPEALREALLTLTGSPDVAERLAAIRDELRAAGGAAAAADIVEAQLPTS